MTSVTTLVASFLSPRLFRDRSVRIFSVKIFFVRLDQTILILGRSAYHRGSVRASHLAGPGSILSVPKFFLEFLDVAEI